MRDRLYTTPALIIRRSDVGEADRLLTIYTPSYGKLAVTARGVRKMTSKLAGHLELFIHTRLQLAKGRTFDVVTESRVVDHVPQLRSDLMRIGMGYYVAELLDKMTADQSENHALFNLACETFAGLDQQSEPLRREMVLRFFEIHLLSLSGYRPHLFHCAQCETVLEPTTERYSPHAGGAICPRCAPQLGWTMAMPLSVFKLLRFLMRGTLDEALALTASPALIQQANEILKASLRQVLERELKSVAFLNLLQS